MRSLAQLLVIVTSLAFSQPTASSDFKPLYPANALNAGMEGWVELTYSVNAACDLVLETHASEPKKIFEDAAVRNARRMLMVEGDLIDWSKIPDANLSEDRPIDFETYKALLSVAKSLGPWPKWRRIHAFQSDGIDLECRFDTNGNLIWVKFYKAGTLQKELTVEEVTPGALLRKEQTFRIRFEIDDENTNDTYE